MPVNPAPIRRLHSKDTHALLDVWQQASRQAHGFLTEQFLTLERINIRHLWLPKAETWVYLEQRRLVGFISVRGDHVGALFVRPDHQFAGIGRALMDHAFLHRRYLQLDVFAANDSGRAFYERYGFRPIGEYTHEATGQAMIRLARHSPFGQSTRSTGHPGEE